MLTEEYLTPLLNSPSTVQSYYIPLWSQCGSS